MRQVLLLVLVSAVGGIFTQQIWAKPHERISQAVSLLMESKNGRHLISRATARWGLADQQELMRLIIPGKVSKTDSVISRQFDPVTGVESQKRDIVIFVKTDQTIGEMALDLAHELAHATARANWDPYDPKLTVGKYIYNAIEGEGGEIEAVVAECRVALELAKNKNVVSDRCDRYFGSSPVRVLPETVRNDFYRVGEWKEELSHQLGKETKLLPLLSANEPELYSSTGHAPYPVALYNEYQEITEVACRNSVKRLGAIRAPASKGVRKAREQTTAFLANRCSKPVVQPL